MIKRIVNSNNFKNTAYCLIALLAIFTSNTQANESKAFVEQLKAHYKDTSAINAFSFNYHFLNKQYRSQNYWDYNIPNRVLSVRMVEVDLQKKQFYDNDILYTPGGQILDRVQFQNDSHSYYYEKNGNYLGKRYFNEGMGNFDRFISYNAMNIDFLAIRPILEENDVKRNITLTSNPSGSIALTHKNQHQQVINYEFDSSSMQLISLKNKTRRAYFTYENYQTTRGITFARLVNKYYDGSDIPAYISFNDNFEVIDQVEPSKLKLPPGYGPEITPGDGVMIAKEIAANLYLVHDSAQWRNSLFKVNGNEIMIFGASGYPEQSEKVIKLIREKFPTKTITTVHVTHPQGNDIGGLAVYAREGIEILADEYTLGGIKAFPAFARDVKHFKFRTLNNEETIGGAQFYILESQHAKRQSFVYFEQGGIIFQADFLNIAFDNTIPKVIPTYTKTFIDFIRSKGLNFNRIVGNYQNNNISVDVVDKTYNAVM